MSATQMPTEHNQPDISRCTRCNTMLPQHATFCGQCGERIKQQGQGSLSLHYGDIVERYRITSLVRRRPYTQLFFAFDNQQQQYVAINAINLHVLEEAKRTQAIETFRHQCDLLQRQSVPMIMHLIDLNYFQEHLYVIANWPEQQKSPQKVSTLSTLSTLLQSGIGLPDEQVAIAWIYRLSRTLELLHNNKIIPGDIDPDSILVNTTIFDSDPALMIFWQPELLPHPSINTNTAYFHAPETLIGDIEPRSDIYSLGAILYLLLSGSTPKNATERIRQPLATLHEINPHINSTIDAVVMRALALEKTERYQSASEFSAALLQLSTNPNDLHLAQKNPVQSTQPVQQDKTQHQKEEIHISSQVADNTIDRQSTTVADEVTVSVVPLQAQMARRYLSKIKSGKTETQGIKSGEESVEEGLTKEKSSTENVITGSITYIGNTSTKNLPGHGPAIEDRSSAEQPAESIEASPLTEQEKRSIELLEESEYIQNQPTNALSPLTKEKDNTKDAEAKLIEIEQQDTVLFKYDVREVENAHEKTKDQVEGGREERKNTTRAIQTQGVLSTPNQTSTNKEPLLERLKILFMKTASTLPGLEWQRGNNTTNRAIATQSATHKESLLLKQVQHFLIGEPHNSTKAAALIETPMRIQPNQNYSIRINVIGRNQAKEPYAAGLSGLVQGEKVHIEVRSALYQNYAYIIQQADIQLPGEGYVAEITMPMQTLSGGPSGRRERLHIFFMDETNNPLYEKPFVIELFISHLVQSGREGHNVLSIPL